MSARSGNVRYQNSLARQIETLTFCGVAFLRLILQYILPEGYRRARRLGFLHPNSKLIPWGNFANVSCSPYSNHARRYAVNVGAEK